MLWVDPADPSVFAAVTDGTFPEAIDLTSEDYQDVRDAVELASNILTPLTAHAVHPSGETTQEFLGNARTATLQLIYRPVRVVTDVIYSDPFRDTTTAVKGWFLHNNAVQLRRSSRVAPSYAAYGRLTPGMATSRGLTCAEDDRLYQVTYEFGSTVTAAARRALLKYAHEWYLFLTDGDECALPEKVTSLSREGITMELLNPQDYLERGKVGIPEVDVWLSSANPTNVRRPSAVYTPERPPGGVTRTTVRRFR